MLSQGGRDLFGAIDTINQKVDEIALSGQADENLAMMADSDALEPTPDLSQMPGVTPGELTDILSTALAQYRNQPQKVFIEGGFIDGIQNPVQAEVENEVAVKHVGALAVTQAGQFVVQLAGGTTIPVRVEGGRMVVDIGGGLGVLATELDEIETALISIGAL